MTMSKVIVVTSGKGGVGKTTSTASIGAALAQNGQRVCVVDFDVGLRNLDLVMGAERRVVYDFINVAQGDAKLTQALIRDKRVVTLYLLAASQTRDKDALTDAGVERVIRELRDSFDWVLCDSPAGIERGALLAMRFADQAIVVTNPEISSVRDSDRIIGLLDSRTSRAERGERMDKQLLLTRFDPGRSNRGEMLSVADVLDILSIPLLGVIPESEEILRASNLGEPVTMSSASPAARSYREAARRLAGETLAMVIPDERKTLLTRLFGRRAACPCSASSRGAPLLQLRASGCRFCSPTSGSRSAHAISLRSCATSSSPPSRGTSTSTRRSSPSKWTAPDPSRRWRSMWRFHVTRSTQRPLAAFPQPRRRRPSIFGRNSVE